MSEVLSIRIPRELKKKMEELKNFVDWKQEIIKFLEERVKYYEKQRILKEVNEIIERHPRLPKGTAIELVREDRDSH